MSPFSRDSFRCRLFARLLINFPHHGREGQTVGIASERFRPHCGLFSQFHSHRTTTKGPPRSPDEMMTSDNQQQCTRSTPHIDTLSVADWRGESGAHINLLRQPRLASIYREEGVKNGKGKKDNIRMAYIGSRHTMCFAPNETLIRRRSANSALHGGCPWRPLLT